MEWGIFMIIDMNKYNELNKKADKYNELFMKQFSLISKTNLLEEKIERTKELYLELKRISKEFYLVGDKEFVGLKNLAEIITWCENIFEEYYITDISTINKEYNTSEEKLLGGIVKEAREYLHDLLTINGKYSHSFDYYNLENYCEKSSDNILEICNKKTLIGTKIKMPYGLNLNYLVYGSGFHCFVIVELNKNNYLVDCTYKQFFNQNRSFLERIGIPHLLGCKPGVFMLMNERRRKVATKILKEGWIKLTPETFKDYMDGFLLSWKQMTFLLPLLIPLMIIGLFCTSKKT